MKKIITAAMTALMALSPLAARTKVVTTIFPAYDWAREVIGTNNAEITMLLDNGVDLHSYQPTVQDIAKISTCNVFVYVGGESDGWVEDALKTARNKNMQVVNLMEVMGTRAKAEEVKEGMEADHHGHNHAHHHDEEEEELDEHVWLSLKNAQLLTNAIYNALVKADSKNAASYKANCEAYIRKLAALDAEYTAAVRGAAQKTLVFCDRFPFRYLVDDYGLDYFAAFVGCSAETEASFKTVAFLANKSDELGIKNVAVIESSDKKIAQTVIQNSKNKSRGIIVFDSMQSTTANDVKKGTTYLSVMRKNLEVLKSALK